MRVCGFAYETLGVSVSVPGKSGCLLARGRDEREGASGFLRRRLAVKERSPPSLEKAADEILHTGSPLRSVFPREARTV